MAYTDIDKPDLYFNTVLWTGDGSSSRNITGIGFKPNWVWVKCRNSAVSHAVYDSVRGASKLINTNTTSAEGTNSAVNAFISDGFTVNSDSYVNLNSNTYVAWNWLGANGTASNTDGTVTSTVSANTTSGFSIVKWTGTGNAEYIGHGLGANADVVIIKNLGSASFNAWYVNHKSVSSTKTLYLNTTDAETTSSIYLNTAPDSTKFRFDSDQTVDHIAYCFAEKKGFSKFGSYVGNGSATANSGTFVYTGFKPSLIIVKNSSSVEGWQMWDNKRSSYNEEGSNLSPNSSNAESTGVRVHLFSNGFQLVSAGADQNSSGDTFIYMAFAENPFVTSTGIPTCAR